MKKLKKLSLKEEVDKEAQEIEKEVESRDNLDDINVSEDMETSLFNKIQEYEYDKRVKKAVHRGRKKRRLFLALAAVLILVCGSVITGTGSKSYWKVLWDRIAGDEAANIINVEDMKIEVTQDTDEIQVFNTIKKEIGIFPVRLGYRPENMNFIQYEIDKSQNRAVLLYEYNGQVIQYSMYMNNKDSSYGRTEIDQVIDEYQVEINNIIIDIKEYTVDNRKNNRYVADFEYLDAQYQLIGLIEKGEFDKIIENLIFYDENA